MVSRSSSTLAAEKSSTVRKHKLGTRLEVEVGPPVVVALARPGEKRWGFHQFPALARLPGGKLALTYSHNADAVQAYGTACPTFVSENGGKTWTRMKSPGHLGSKPHPSICEVAEGEYLCVPPTRPFNLKTARLSMPRPVVAGRGGGTKSLHRFKDCPPAVQAYIRELDAWRWKPGAKRWSPEKIIYDTDDLLVWKRAKGSEAHLVPRTWFEHPPVKLGNELIYADYRTKYLGKSGKADPYGTSTCMVSKDKGKTWTRRGTIAVGRAKSPKGEPVIAPTSDGRLACAIRTSPGPLVITFSKDRGRTWTPVKPLHKFGVFPGLLLLDSKVMVVSFGRLGVHMKFSGDGTGRKWTKPVSLVPARGNWSELSCGYTSLLAVGKDEFLIAYSDFKHRDAKGRERKAIMVRRVKVIKSGELKR
jgi:BNR repeat-like domain